MSQSLLKELVSSVFKSMISKFKDHVLILLFFLGKFPGILDMALLIDTSKSMSPNQRKAVDTTLNLLIDKLGVSPEGNHYAFIIFDYEVTVLNNFKDPRYYTINGLKADLRKRIMHDPRNWGTRADLAMDLAATQLFTPAGGDRPNAANVLMVVTDGKPNIERGDKTPLIPFFNSTKVLEVSQT